MKLTSHLGVIILLALVLIAVGCFHHGENALLAIDNDNQMDILGQFAEDYPDQFSSMTVNGVNISETMLCFHALNGDTYIYRQKSRTSEKVEHA